MLLSFITLSSHGERPNVAEITNIVKRVPQHEHNINLIICDQSFNAFIPNVLWIVHQIKLILEKDVLLYKTTYSMDGSIVIGHYQISGALHPLLISYPAQNQITGEMAITNRNTQEIFLCETLISEKYIKESKLCSVNYYANVKSHLQEESMFVAPAGLQQKTLKRHLELKKRENICFCSGVIINAETPDDTSVFPRRGGEAWALYQATGYPFIHMHRDAKARSDEGCHLKTIKDGSVVHIIGHGNSGSEEVTGLYISTDSQVVVNIEWTLEQYHDLIMQNSTLKMGDTLTIVLWACYAGAGGRGSTAVQFSELFRNKGIYTRIIASIDPVLRFRGVKAGQVLQTDGVEFMIKTDHRSIRIFTSSGKCIIQHKNQKPLAFLKNTILGYEPIEPTTTVATPSPFYKPPLKQVLSSRHYNATFDAQLAETFLEQNQDTLFILRPSKKKRDMVELVFVLTFKIPSFQAFSRILFFIEGDELYYEKYNEIELVSLEGDNLESVLEGIMRSVSALEINKHQAKQSMLPPPVPDRAVVVKQPDTQETGLVEAGCLQNEDSLVGVLHEVPVSTTIKARHAGRLFQPAVSKESTVIDKSKIRMTAL